MEVRIALDAISQLWQCDLNKSSLVPYLGRGCAHTAVDNLQPWE